MNHALEPDTYNSRITTSTKCWISVGIMLGRRHRLWANSIPALSQLVLFAWIILLSIALRLSTPRA